MPGLTEDQKQALSDAFEPISKLVVSSMIQKNNLIFANWVSDNSKFVPVLQSFAEGFAAEIQRVAQARINEQLENITDDSLRVLLQKNGTNFRMDDHFGAQIRGYKDKGGISKWMEDILKNQDEISIVIEKLKEFLLEPTQRDIEKDYNYGINGVPEKRMVHHEDVGEYEKEFFVGGLARGRMQELYIFVEKYPEFYEFFVRENHKLLTAAQSFEQCFPQQKSKALGQPEEGDVDFATHSEAQDLDEQSALSDVDDAFQHVNDCIAKLQDILGANTQGSEIMPQELIDISLQLRRMTQGSISETGMEFSAPDTTDRIEPLRMLKEIRRLLDEQKNKVSDNKETIAGIERDIQQVQTKRSELRLEIEEHTTKSQRRREGAYNFLKGLVKVESHSEKAQRLNDEDCVLDQRLSELQETLSNESQSLVEIEEPINKMRGHVRMCYQNIAELPEYENEESVRHYAGIELRQETRGPRR